MSILATCTGATHVLKLCGTVLDTGCVPCAACDATYHVTYQYLGAVTHYTVTKTSATCTWNNGGANPRLYYSPTGIYGGSPDWRVFFSTFEVHYKVDTDKCPALGQYSKTVFAAATVVVS